MEVAAIPTSHAERIPQYASVTATFALYRCYGMPYQFECSADHCQFLIRSSSSDEVERLVRAHVRMTHDGRIAPADIERGMERIELA